jgi:hypothetical protein
MAPGASCSARHYRRSSPPGNGEICSLLPEKYLNGYANEKHVVILVRYATLAAVKIAEVEFLHRASAAAAAREAALEDG